MGWELLERCKEAIILFAGDFHSCTMVVSSEVGCVSSESLAWATCNLCIRSMVNELIRRFCSWSHDWGLRWSGYAQQNVLCLVQWQASYKAMARCKMQWGVQLLQPFTGLCTGLQTIHWCYGTLHHQSLWILGILQGFCFQLSANRNGNEFCSPVIFV